MKIQVNYDLLNCIVESQKGFSLNRTAKYVGFCTSVSTVLDLVIPKDFYMFLGNVMLYLILHSILGTGIQLSASPIRKIVAETNIKYLLPKLHSININTDKELLSKSYKYHTDYEIITEEKAFPRVKQEKYIMVPVYENGEEKEVSVLQEHIIGSNKYELSIGEPQKVLKLVPKKV